MNLCYRISDYHSYLGQRVGVPSHRCWLEHCGTRHSGGSLFAAGFHGVADICTLGKIPLFPRNRANHLIRPTAIVWLVLNCSSLVILVVLYNVAREELNFNNTAFKEPAWFYGAVGLVLAMAPVHYGLLHYQVE